MKIILLFLIIFNYLYAKESLKFKKILFLDSSLEISGITKNQNDELLIVSDNDNDQFIYKLDTKDNKILTSFPMIKINDFNGFFQYYYSTLFSYSGERWLKSPWDIEGLYRCGEDYFLVNEQARHVLKVSISSKKLTHLNLDYKNAFQSIGVKLNAIATNAGFEGLALDCENKILFIAQERDPRAIFIYNLKTKEYIDFIQTKTDTNSNISPDYSDLFYEDGFLYALERNEWRILKIDLESKKVIKSISFNENYLLDLKKIYKTGKPYGLAEALYMDQDEIIIGIDNNGSPLTKRAEIIFNNFKENSSSIIYFERPEGF